MDRRKYILKRLEKELCSLGYEDPFLYRDGENFIAAIFPMNEDTEKFYTVQISWIVDDEDDRILFRGERVLQEVCEKDEAAILHFCNAWNKTSFKCWTFSFFTCRICKAYYTHNHKHYKNKTNYFLHFVFSF